MSKDGRIWLSHTGIEGLQRCPKCFWLQYKKGIRQPEGIVSRLANRFDKVIKTYFDRYRTLGKLPPMVEDKFSEKLQNPFQETYFYRINEKYGFLGKLDECLVTDNGELIPVDFKTSSSDPREKETLEAYQTQIDDYVFLIKNNNNKVTGFGYLLYFYPDFGEELHNGFPMILHLQRLDANPKNTEKRIAKAIEILEGEMPTPSETCAFCSYRRELNELEDL